MPLHREPLTRNKRFAAIEHHPVPTVPTYLPRQDQQLAAGLVHGIACAELLKHMQTDKDIHLEFKMAMRGKKKLTYPLDGFRELKAGVDRVMAGQ